MQDFVTVISTVGFPIAACAALGYFVKYVIDQDRQQIKELQNQHREEMVQITQALSNNTLAIQRLTDLLAYQEGVQIDKNSAKAPD